jgi:23S rRNA pseudouridine1911/1915/1917 synthase
VPATEWGWLITPEELASWILVDDERLLVVNKPPFVVCHPSKQGPWSSLIGACREYAGLERLHMPSRLDRETSGVVVFAKDRELGSRLQTAIAARRVRKTYLAVVHGLMTERVLVDQPIGRDGTSVVRLRQWVRENGDAAQTEFIPICGSPSYTLLEVHPRTGRLHQIRVHASWLGHPVVGDKLYGPDEGIFLEFIEHGWTPAMAERLPLPRQALHASRIEFDLGGGVAMSFDAPLTPDLQAFCAEHSLVNAGVSGATGRAGSPEPPHGT